MVLARHWSLRKFKHFFAKNYCVRRDQGEVVSLRLGGARVAYM